MSVWNDITALWKKKTGDERLNISFRGFVTAAGAYLAAVAAIIGIIWSASNDWTVTLGLTIPILAIAWTIAKNSIGSMPSNTFGQRSFFGRRYGKPVHEGLYLKFPGSKVSELTLKPSPVVIEYQVASSDNLKMTGNVTVTTRVDPTILDGFGRIICLNIEEKDRVTQLKSRVVAWIGKIGGMLTGEQFRREQGTIQMIVASFLRLSQPPHTDPTRFGFIVPGGGEVLRKDRLVFYTTCADQINKELRAESSKPDEHSTTELDLGIDVLDVAVPQPDFSKETWLALEKKKQAESQMEAKEAIFTKARQIAAALMAENPNLSARDALDRAWIMVDKGTLQVQSISGEGLGNTNTIVGIPPWGIK